MRVAPRMVGRALLPVSGGVMWLLVLPLLLSMLACSEGESDRQPLTAELPLHLEEHLDVSTLEGAEPAPSPGRTLEWSFEAPQPDWHAVQPLVTSFEAISKVHQDDALRLTLTEANRTPEDYLVGALYVALPDLSLEDWSFVEIRARTEDRLRYMGLDFNWTSEDPWGRDGTLPFAAAGDYTPLLTDGSIQTYRLSLDVRREGRWDGPWKHLAVWFTANEPAEVDLLSVRVLPREATYAVAPVGVRTEVRGQAHRRALYTHTPSRLEYRVRVPVGARLDLGLGVLRRDTPVRFRITAEVAGRGLEMLLDETYSDRDRWAQRSVDLNHLSGRTVTLGLEANSGADKTVAFWAAPTLTGERRTGKPNVIFYVIDGGSAEHMSLYGYNRRTTPNLERLARGGAIFERTFSNATWTSPSTASFLTSLHTSVLGGYRGTGRTMLPEQAKTIGEHLHQAGYQTAGFTTNGYAGAEAGLGRGADVFRDGDTASGSTSSEDLHEDYWRWREEYPGEPYWVHFQTTDVHRPFDSVPPFAGLYVQPELRRRYEAWEDRLVDAVGQWRASIARPDVVFEVGIDPATHFEARRGLLDEAMAHQDSQIGQLVERLKARGEWERTLLVVAADHGPVGIPSARSSYEPMFQSLSSKVPLLFVWPGQIRCGQHFSQPVSMIDVMPTILDLLDLPIPEVAQGQSLAPLLLGEPDWKPRPVILDEFAFDREANEVRGVIEIVDGRWGASLEVNSHPDRFPREGPQGLQREVPLLIFDLWEDPQMEHSLHEERPDLVEKYTRILERQFRANRKLAQRFTATESEGMLTPEQLRTLRSLGYID